MCRAHSFKSSGLLTYYDSRSFRGSQKAKRYGRNAPRSQRYAGSIVTVHILDILQMIPLSRTKRVTVGADRGHAVHKSEEEKLRRRQQKCLGEQTRGTEEDKTSGVQDGTLSCVLSTGCCVWKVHSCRLSEYIKNAWEFVRTAGTIQARTRREFRGHTCCQKKCQFVCF